MIKYFVKPGHTGMVSFNSETEDIDCVHYMRSYIDWMYMVPEDGELKANGTTKNVKKGDIVIQFYKNEGTDTNVIIIKSAEWKKRIKDIEKHDEKMRKELAAKTACEPRCGECEPCCEECESCN